MNGFSADEVSAEKVVNIPAALEPRHNKDKEGNKTWPWYASKLLFLDLEIPFRDVSGAEEMLLDDSVYIVSAQESSLFNSGARRARISFNLWSG